MKEVARQSRIAGARKRVSDAIAKRRREEADKEAQAELSQTRKAIKDLEGDIASGPSEEGANVEDLRAQLEEARGREQELEIAARRAEIIRLAYDLAGEDGIDPEDLFAREDFPMDLKDVPPEQQPPPKEPQGGLPEWTQWLTPQGAARGIAGLVSGGETTTSGEPVQYGQPVLAEGVRVRPRTRESVSGPTSTERVYRFKNEKGNWEQISDSEIAAMVALAVSRGEDVTAESVKRGLGIYESE
jgi:hypothetical protein